MLSRVVVRQSGKVVVLFNVVLEFVEFLAVRPACVVPALRENRPAELRTARDNRVDDILSGCLGILELREEVSSLKIVGRLYPAQCRKCRKTRFRQDVLEGR